MSSSAEHFGLFVDAIAGCFLIFGMPVIVDQIIRSAYPDQTLTDVGTLLSFAAVTLLVSFMVNLGLYLASSYGRTRYIAAMAVSLILAAAIYVLIYIYLVEPDSTPAPTTGTPTPTP